MELVRGAEGGLQHSFIWVDIKAILLAIPLFAPYLLAPGYVVARLTNLLGFRTQSAGMQLALSMAASFAVLPICVNLLARFLSLHACSLLLLAFSALALVLLLPQGARAAPRASAHRWIPWTLLVIWLLICVGSFPDLQVGHRLWSSVLIYDDGIRAAFIDATLRSGAPPHNPLCFFGQPIPSRYYYYWSTVCALPAALGGLGARAVLAASSFWCGIAFAALIPVYLRCLLGVGRRLRRWTLLGVALLSVTGLDLLPTALTYLFRGSVKADMEWWDNNQVTSWIDALLWTPHHVAGLIACLFGFLLVWRVAQSVSRPVSRPMSRPGPAQRVPAKPGASAGAAEPMRHAPLSPRLIASHLTVGALAFASAAGLSVYIAFCFLLFLLVWLIRLACRRQFRPVFAFVASGVLSILISLPFLGDLRVPATGRADFRTGRPAHLFTTGLRTSGWIKAHVRQPHLWRTPLLLLDMGATYIVELGFFLLVLILVGRRFYLRRHRMTEAETALCYLLAVTLVAATFLRSEAIRSNDFGMRAILLAQWILLLWAIPLLDGLLLRPSLVLASRPLLKTTLFATLLLGAGASLYQLVLLRAAAPLDASLSPKPVYWLPGPSDGRAGFLIRSAETELYPRLTPDSVVQYDPFNADFLQMLIYTHHQIAAATMPDCGAPFGGSAAACARTKALLRTIFAEGSAPVGAGNLDAACRAAFIDVLLVQASDPVWRIPGSWVWQRTPLLANAYVRVFRCGAKAGL